MKKFTVVLILLMFSSFSLAQGKYFIYFKDKGSETTQSLSKSSQAFIDAEKQLTQKSLERRKAVMGEDNYITYEDLPVNKNYVAQLEAAGIKIEKILKWFNAVSSYLTDEQAERIKLLPFVEKIEKIRRLKPVKPEANNITIEPKYGLGKTNSALDYGVSLTQNQLSEIPVLHNIGISGQGVIVGLLDSGFGWKTHPVFQNLKVNSEWDFINNDNVTANENEMEAQVGQDKHGTSVLSIIAGFAPGNLIGPAYGASFLLAKTEDITSEKNIEEDNYAAALEWMDSLGVDITSSSLGYTTFDGGERSYTYQEMDGKTTIVARATNLAFERGISTFTSAGNEGNKTWHYISSPGDAFDILTIGAVTSANEVTAFSSRGPTSDGRIKPEIVAMGSSVVNAYMDTKFGPSYTSGNGTSYSAPIAAGVAALLKSAHQHLTNAQIRKIMMESTDNTLTPNNDRGYGLISAKKAITFPNLSLDGSQFTLHKIFINEQGVNSNTVKLNYRIEGGEFLSVNMNYDGLLKYTYSFNGANPSQLIEFYFTYETNSGSVVTEPSSSYYKFSYGSNQIHFVNDVDDTNKDIPIDFHLFQNYPNPFNPGTTIKYFIPVGMGHTPSGMQVNLEIYDVLGRKITTLVNTEQSPGVYEVQLNAETLGLSSGVYFYRLTAGQFSETKKFVFLK